MKQIAVNIRSGRIQALFLILFLMLPILAPLSHASVTKRMVGRVTYEVIPGDDIQPDIDLDSQGRQGQLHALFIAIDRYPGIPGGDLGLPVSDSKKMADALMHTFGVPQRNIQFLHDDQATREGIRRALNSLADTSRVSPYDQVLVMFSGHGLTIPNHAGDDIGFLVPYDAEVTLDGSNPEAVLRTCLPMDEMRRLARFLPARHTLFLADCCYGGLASLRSEPMSAPTLKQALSLRSIQIITAGSAEEEVLESPAWGGSAMTHLLLRLFNDESRPEWQDNIITASEMGAYIREELPRLVRQVAPSHRQTPQFERMEGMGEFFLARPEHTPNLLPPLEAARQAGDGVSGPAGLLFDMDLSIPERAEITQTEFQDALHRSFSSQGFQTYDKASLDSAMRAGDEAPTRFIVRGSAEYWIDQTNEDPLNLGRNAMRARLNANVSVHDIYTGRVAIHPVNIVFNEPFYLVEDVRDAIIKKVEPYAEDIAKALAEYVRPPVPTGPASDPVAVVFFHEDIRSEDQNLANQLINDGLRPALMEALNNFPNIRMVPEEQNVDCFQAMGRSRSAFLPVRLKGRYVDCSDARYTITVRYQRLGPMVRTTLVLTDHKNPSKLPPPQRVQTRLSSETPNMDEFMVLAEEAFRTGILPQIEIK